MPVFSELSIKLVVIAKGVLFNFLPSRYTLKVVTSGSVPNNRQLKNT